MKEKKGRIDLEHPGELWGSPRIMPMRYNEQPSDTKWPRQKTVEVGGTAKLRVLNLPPSSFK